MRLDLVCSVLAFAYLSECYSLRKIYNGEIKEVAQGGQGGIGGEGKVGGGFNVGGGVGGGAEAGGGGGGEGGAGGKAGGKVGGGIGFSANAGAGAGAGGKAGSLVSARGGPKKPNNICPPPPRPGEESESLKLTQLAAAGKNCKRAIPRKGGMSQPDKHPPSKEPNGPKPDEKDEDGKDEDNENKE